MHVALPNKNPECDSGRHGHPVGITEWDAKWETAQAMTREATGL